MFHESFQPPTPRTHLEGFVAHVDLKLKDFETHLCYSYSLSLSKLTVRKYLTPALRTATLLTATRTLNLSDVVYLSTNMFSSSGVRHQDFDAGGAHAVRHDIRHKSQKFVHKYN